MASKPVRLSTRRTKRSEPSSENEKKFRDAVDALDALFILELEEQHFEPAFATLRQVPDTQKRAVFLETFHELCAHMEMKTAALFADCLRLAFTQWPGEQARLGTTEHVKDRISEQVQRFIKWACDGPPNRGPDSPYASGWKEPWCAPVWLDRPVSSVRREGDKLHVDIAWTFRVPPDGITNRLSQERTSVVLEELAKAARNQIMGAGGALWKAQIRGIAEIALAPARALPADREASREPKAVLTGGEDFAGKLFFDASENSANGKVAKEALFQIAAQLDSDDSSFRDPREHLPPKWRDQLAAYNRSHPRAAITTWSALARNSHFIRGFRVLLYDVRRNYKKSVSKQPAPTTF